MVNKQGQTRLAQYYEYLTLEERRALEGEIVRKCLARNEQQVLFYTYICMYVSFFNCGCYVYQSTLAMLISGFGETLG